MHDGHDWYWQSRWSGPGPSGPRWAGPDDGYHHHSTRVAPDDMRISDVERTEVINQLCRHFGDGRLDQAELDERTAKAMAAKTRRELAPLLADLPPLDQTPVQGPPPPIRHRPGFPLVLAVVIAVILAAGWPVHLFLVHAWHVPWLLVFLIVFFLLRRRRRPARF